MAHEQTRSLQLISSVISRGDVRRLSREVEALDTFLDQASVRNPGTGAKLPKLSRLADELVAANKLNMLQKADRQLLRDFLAEMEKNAPSIHMSFSSDPSVLFMQKLVLWLRRNIHPGLLVQVGLQPTIGAGCILRTTNQYFDLSLQKRFDTNKTQLLTMLRATADKQKDAA